MKNHPTCSGSYNYSPEKGDKLVIYGSKIEEKNGEPVLSALRLQYMEIELDKVIKNYEDFFEIYIKIEKNG